MSRFWSTFWTVLGCLLLVGWVAGITGEVVGLFGLLSHVAPTVSLWLALINLAVVPIWAALTFIDWRWGWTTDNAGLRLTPAAVFWLLPGLLAGGLAAAFARLITGGPLGLAPLSAELLALVLLVAVQIFGAELIYRGVAISRLQYDLAGRDLLILAIGIPFVWTLAQQVIVRLIFISPVPGTGIAGLGTAAVSVFLSLLFLRTDSVWLAAGVRMGLVITAALLGVGRVEDLRVLEQGLLIVFGIPAVILLLLEINKFGNLRRPDGPRGGGRQRVVYGKTVRGPWGPH